MLNRRRDERDNIIDSSDEMPLEGHDSKDHVHRLLALGKNVPCCNQQHDVLIPFDGTAGRRCNPRPSYFMPLNFFYHINDGLALCRIPLLSYIIPHHVPSRHEVRNCLLMEFYGGRAAPVRQIIFTGIRSAEGLVGQIPTDVDIGDLRQPFGGGGGGVSEYSLLSMNDIREFRQ